MIHILPDCRSADTACYLGFWLISVAARFVCANSCCSNRLWIDAWEFHCRFVLYIKWFWYWQNQCNNLAGVVSSIRHHSLYCTIPLHRLEHCLRMYACAETVPAEHTSSIYWNVRVTHRYSRHSLSCSIAHVVRKGLWLTSTLNETYPRTIFNNLRNTSLVSIVLGQ